MQNCELLNLTKAEKKLLHLIKRNTLNKNTTLAREKKSFRMTNEQIAIELGCTERTIQRGVKKLAELNLIRRNVPTKKFMRGPHYIAISADFHLLTKSFFASEKNVTLSEQNVAPVKRIIIKTINLSINNISNKTNNNKSKTAVEFSLSETIKKLDLKNLDQEIGLTYSDLEEITTKAKWQNPDLQESINNYAHALETKAFIPTILSPREAFIRILLGNEKKGKKPKKFGRMVASTPKNTAIETEENKKIEQQVQIEKQIQEKDENYWLSLPDSEKQNYLNKSNGDTKKAISIAVTQQITVNLREAMAINFLTEKPLVRDPKRKITFSLNLENPSEFKEIEGQLKGLVQFLPISGNLTQ